MTKLDSTTLTSIALSVLAANMFKADMGKFFVLGRIMGGKMCTVGV